MQAIERRRLELPQPLGNDAAPRFERIRETAAQVHVHAVQQQMSRAKEAGVGNQIVERYARCRIVRGDHRSRRQERIPGEVLPKTRPSPARPITDTRPAEAPSPAETAAGAETGPQPC